MCLYVHHPQRLLCLGSQFVQDSISAISLTTCCSQASRMGNDLSDSTSSSNLSICQTILTFLVRPYLLFTHRAYICSCLSLSASYWLFIQEEVL